MTDPQPTADLVARISASTAALGSPDSSDALPLPELTAQLTALHDELRSALSELDRT